MHERLRRAPTGRNLTMSDVPWPRSPSSLRLRGHLLLGTYPRFSPKKSAWGPFPAASASLWVTGPLRDHGCELQEVAAPTDEPGVERSAVVSRHRQSVA
jgi:hypothetical protein